MEENMRKRKDGAHTNSGKQEIGPTVEATHVSCPLFVPLPPVTGRRGSCSLVEVWSFYTVAWTLEVPKATQHVSTTALLTNHFHTF